MTISQKCNCCMHEAVCSQRDTYTAACKVLTDTSKHWGCEIDIHIKCPHFVVKQSTEKTITTNINRI